MFRTCNLDLTSQTDTVYKGALGSDFPPTTRRRDEIQWIASWRGHGGGAKCIVTPQLRHFPLAQIPWKPFHGYPDTLVRMGAVHASSPYPSPQNVDQC